MPTYYATLRTPVGEIGPDDIEAPDAQAAIEVARRELLGALDAVFFVSKPRGWRIVIRDDQETILADVPALAHRST